MKIKFQKKKKKRIKHQIKTCKNRHRILKQILNKILKPNASIQNEIFFDV